jgi:hypothetical protein
MDRRNEENKANDGFDDSALGSGAREESGATVGGGEMRRS